jgi:hypothetical protein
MPREDHELTNPRNPLFKYRVTLSNNSYQLIEAGYFVIRQENGHANAYFYVRPEYENTGPENIPNLGILVGYVHAPLGVTFSDEPKMTPVPSGPWVDPFGYPSHPLDIISFR